MAGPKKRSVDSLHSSLIEDYCMIGDCETAALVSREGSIDWLCWPTFSSGACFAALLGTRDHGYWKISPIGRVKAIRREYRAHTLVVETTLRPRMGWCAWWTLCSPRAEHSHVVRIVRGMRGTVAMQMDLAIRFDYGRTVPWVTSIENELHAVAGPDMVVLRTEVPMRGEGMTTRSEFVIRAGDSASFTLTSLSSLEKVPSIPLAETALDETCAFWTEWNEKNKYSGPYAGGSRAILDDLEGDDLQAFGRNCCGCNDLSAGEDRGHTQLGLSILLVAGYGVYAADSDAGGLCG